MLQTILIVLARVGLVFMNSFVVMLQNELLNPEIKNMALSIVTIFGDI